MLTVESAWIHLVHLGPRPRAAVLEQPEPRVPGLERSGTPGCHGSRQAVTVHQAVTVRVRGRGHQAVRGRGHQADRAIRQPEADPCFAQVRPSCQCRPSGCIPDAESLPFSPCKDGRVPSCLMAPIRRSARRAPAVRRRGRYWPDGGAPGPSRGCQAPLGARGPGRSGRRPSRPESDGPRGASPPPGPPLPAEGFRSVPPAAPGWNSLEAGPGRATPRIRLPCCPGPFRLPVTPRPVDSDG